MRVSSYICFLTAFLLLKAGIVRPQARRVIKFNDGWSFMLSSDTATTGDGQPKKTWRSLSLPHDWSIESDFSSRHPSTNQGGALPGGTGWYRKRFGMPSVRKGVIVRIEFDGVYRDSEVWINGHYLGKRPNGYVGFAYEITAYLLSGVQNELVVKVDNSRQPDSRWYTGSGIYRDVRIVMTDAVAVAQWGSFITTPDAGEDSAIALIRHDITNATGAMVDIRWQTQVFDPKGRLVASSFVTRSARIQPSGSRLEDRLVIHKPLLWSVDHPNMYRAVVRIFRGGKETDRYETDFGIRTIRFDVAKGFLLNKKTLMLKGVCMHHDLGALGAVANTRAMERQLRILKEMGCNAIRTAHNPPAAAFLDLCDRMGFLVMDEAFDMWKKKKNKFDYHLDFTGWHERDLKSMVLRDRNHPSVFMWSIGNEIREQFDSSGILITGKLASIVRSVDSTRPIISALTETFPEKNFIFMSGALDVLGFNYKSYDYPFLPERFPGQTFIATETASALQTRGVYQQPSDSIRVWPPDHRSQTNFTGGNSDHTSSAYDNTHAYWGVTHERAWLDVKRNPHMAGAFVWSGFDYLGEPTPYPFPARSSYFGIIDLAGFPKDVYHMYRSEWTDSDVLHIFPHWNWKPGDTIDVWAYYNNADEVELLLNGKSVGSRRKDTGSLHVQWRLPYEPGSLRAVTRKDGREVLIKEVSTAGKPARINLSADRYAIRSDGKDLSFITATILDAKGVTVPDADREIVFSIHGPARIAGTDNGYQADTTSLQLPRRMTWKGLALAIIGSTHKKGNVTIVAKAAGLPDARLLLKTY
jgi:beta-galactosidase